MRQSEEQKNQKNAPALTVGARIIKKWRQPGGEGDPTTYHARFQVQSGDMMVLSMSKNEFLKLNEGETGWLYFKGNQYQGFVRSSQI